MLLLVLCALMGAYLGLSGRNALAAALMGGVIASATHVVLTYALGFLIAFAPNRYVARHLVEEVGLLGPSLTVVASAAIGAALVAGVLGAFVSPSDDRRQTEYPV
jgi:hypothetical protein